jgi:hypothetical protein
LDIHFLSLYFHQFIGAFCSSLTRRLALQYTKSDGTLGTCVKEVDLAAAEQARRDRRLGWASSEGVEKAMVLKQYVQVRATSFTSFLRSFFRLFVCSLFYLLVR